MCGYVGMWVGVLSVNESLHKIIVHALRYENHCVAFKIRLCAHRNCELLAVCIVSLKVRLR